MAAEERILQKKFGETGGTTEFGAFGSLAEGSPSTTKNLDTIQSLETFLRGWFGATDSGSEPPRLEDMNGLFLLLFSQIKYILEAGIPEWLNDSGQRYYANRSVVTYNGSVYLAIQGDDAGSINSQRNPATETAWWRLLLSVNGAVNLSGAQTVDGVKTFSQIPVLPAANPTTDNQAARKKYADDLKANSDAQVDAIEARTITGSNGLSGGGSLGASRVISGVNASTSLKGVVQLDSSTSSTSTTKAATPLAVKNVKDQANNNASAISTNAGAISTLDGQVVKKTGGQTVGGLKNFTEGVKIGKLIEGNIVGNSGGQGSVLASELLALMPGDGEYIINGRIENESSGDIYLVYGAVKLDATSVLIQTTRVSDWVVFNIIVNTSTTTVYNWQLQG
jgi:hypothetical protein